MMTYILAEAALPYFTRTGPKGRRLASYEPEKDYSPDRDYVIIEKDGMQAAGRLRAMGMKPFDDYYDRSDAYMWGLPVDWRFGQAEIGRCSFYNSAEFDFAARMFFERVGRYTSINETAYFQHDHPLNMIGTGRFQQLMSFENQARYFARVKEDEHISNPGEKIVIGNDVWIGAGAFIDVSRCRSIGDGAIIAAGAVVTCDVPPYAVMAGVPARVKKYRFDEKHIELLLKVKWWEWEPEDINAAAELLMKPELFFEHFS